MTRLCLALLLLAGLVRARADDAAPRNLRVQFIAASTSETPKTDKRLAALLPLLKNLSHNSYRLLDESTIRLPGATPLALSQGFVLALQDKGGGKVGVTITRKGKTVMDTPGVVLVENRPLVLGGFPDGDGTSLLLVLTHVAEGR
ncbi:MAG: hypothetical protein BWZ02_00557 [Lentisphaerae bacterium ADurb.BinA184]|nr:MAG: hypothetical protein BWZ02_00557 [Lentisphaerae bacterium ADurb.BinA184]